MEPKRGEEDKERGMDGWRGGGVRDIDGEREQAIER
jgi:hypothetical protein